MTTETCSFPVGEDAHPCRRPSVAAYIVGDEPFYRCKKHDGPSVRAVADEKGITRLPVGPSMAGDLRDFPTGDAA